MNWQQRMESAIDYIEQNLEQEISYSCAAAEANCSTFHFLRMFSVVTGTTLGEYIRRRRLSMAALQLSLEGGSIASLAARYGYDSPDAFARAFKREFDTTPSEARMHGVRLRTWPRISFSIVLKGDTAMEFRLEPRPAFSIIGPSITTAAEGGKNFIEIPAFWQRAQQQGDIEKLADAASPDSPLGGYGGCA